VAERERRLTPPYGGVFLARTRVMDAGDMQRAIWRIAHEIVERNHGTTGVALVGLQTGGVPLAYKLAAALAQIDPGRAGLEAMADRFGDGPTEPGASLEVPVGTLDVAFYRDDIGLRPVLPEAVTDIPFALDGRIVVLVDDVLFTGRTIRAALDALTDYGRPRAVQLAVMVDRGHRELPIRPDYVGKNLPTRRDEAVDVKEDGVDLGEVVK
jgi:pyrimidine operon attenuation protein / uracil phosphoribosyltransferase